MEIPQIPDLIIYAIPFFVATVIIEAIVISKISTDGYSVKDALASISMGLGNVGIGVISKLFIVLIITFIFDNYRITTIPFTWWSWIFILLADDFCYYWAHRLGHESRFFWASHVVHHSSQKYNLSTALRQTWTGGFFTFIFYLGLPFLGFHPIMIFTQMSISLLYQYWIHTELIRKMPSWFEFAFNTPSHHRVHHGANPLYLDKNYGGILIIWDRLFQTFQAELTNEKVTYGLTTNISSHNPFYIAFHEWGNLFKDIFRSSLSISNKLKYLFFPPGWRHDGTGKTAKEIHQEWLKHTSKN